jgi:hypothetical protein
MSTSLSIAMHIDSLPEHALFNNIDFLPYGCRSTVDWVLHKAAKQGHIQRLAYGVYWKPSPFADQIPSIKEIANFKAKVFKRSISEDNIDAARAAGLTDEENEYPTFLTNGHTSSFKTTTGVRVKFKKTANRKVALDDVLIPQTIKAVWSRGEDLVRQSLDKATEPFGRKERAELKKHVKLMPAWLADVITTGTRAKRTKQEESRYWQDVERNYKRFERDEFDRLMFEKTRHTANLNGNNACEKPINDDDMLTSSWMLQLGAPNKLEIELENQLQNEFQGSTEDDFGEFKQLPFAVDASEPNDVDDCPDSEQAQKCRSTDEPEESEEPAEQLEEEESDVAPRTDTDL